MYVKCENACSQSKNSCLEWMVSKAERRRQQGSTKKGDSEW
jgi:hypothetical protein